VVPGRGCARRSWLYGHGATRLFGTPRLYNRCPLARHRGQARIPRTSEPASTPNRGPYPRGGGLRSSPGSHELALQLRPRRTGHAPYPTLPPGRCVHDRTRTRSSSTVPVTRHGFPLAVGSYRLPRTGGGVPSGGCSAGSCVSLHSECTYGALSSGCCHADPSFGTLLHVAISATAAI